MIRAVAWDIDGTLIDSEPAHHDALMRVSGRYGAEIAQDDPRFLGLAMEQVFDILTPHYPAPLTLQGWLDEIVEDYVNSADALNPMRGGREAVLALAEAGVPQGAVSNSVRRVVEANLRRLNLGEALAFAIAREDVARGKPDPAPYAMACRRFGVAPEQVLAVEDSDVGAASAHNAGLRVLRVDPEGHVFAEVLRVVLGRVG